MSDLIYLHFITFFEYLAKAPTSVSLNCIQIRNYKTTVYGYNSRVIDYRITITKNVNLSLFIRIILIRLIAEYGINTPINKVPNTDR